MRRKPLALVAGALALTPTLFVLTGCSGKSEAPTDTAAPKKTETKTADSGSEKPAEPAGTPGGAPGETKKEAEATKPGTTETAKSDTPEAVAPTTPASKPTPGGEVDAVKKMLTETSQAKNLKEVSDHLTNESAAVTSVMMIFTVAMAVGMEEMMAKQAPAGKQPPMTISKNDPNLKKDLEEYTKKFGLSNQTPPNDKQAIAKLNKQGRAMLAGLDPFVTRLQKASGRGDMNIAKQSAQLTKEMASFSYKVVNPTTVKITAKNQKQPLEARFEDGAWRLHMGSLDELMKARAGMGMPPGGPGMAPGGPGGPPPGGPGGPIPGGPGGAP